MKVRWTSESVRLRITPAELAMLLDGAVVRERLALPGGELAAALRPGEDTAELRLDGGTLVVALARADVERLADPASEGVYFDGNGRARYLVEKDFPCAHPHAPEAREPLGDRFQPTPAYHARKAQAAR